jgi:hypothetical protein
MKICNEAWLLKGFDFARQTSKKGAALYGPFYLGRFLRPREDDLKAERLPLVPSEPPGGQDGA